MKTWFLVPVLILMTGCKSEAEREYDKEKAKAKAQIDAFRELVPTQTVKDKKDDESRTLFKLKLVESASPFKTKIEEWAKWGKEPNRTQEELQQAMDAVKALQSQAKQSALNFADSWNAKNPEHPLSQSELNEIKLEIHRSL